MTSKEINDLKRRAQQVAGGRARGIWEVGRPACQVPALQDRIREAGKRLRRNPAAVW